MAAEQIEFVRQLRIAIINSSADFPYPLGMLKLWEKLAEVGELTGRDIERIEEVITELKEAA